MYAVETEGLTKRFGDEVALRGIDLRVEPATVLGLLGPNGSGKTTTVRILTTLLRADGGRAFIDGVDVAADPRRVRSRIGLTGQHVAVDDRLTARENLRHVARLFHLRRREAAARIDDLLDRFDLVGPADRVTKGYSGGMRRRLDLAMSLVSRPAVLFLDEPTTGLDPRSRLAMWNLIDELVADGTTTVLTTQYLEEAERLADSVVVIDHGRVIADGTVDELKARTGADRLTVDLVRADELERTAALLRDHLEVTGEAAIDRVRRTLTVSVNDVHATVPAVVRLLDDAGVDVLDVAVRRPTLDDVFLQLTGHSTSTLDLEPDVSTTAVSPATPAPPPVAIDEADEILRILATRASTRPPGQEPVQLTDPELEATLRALRSQWSPPSDGAPR